MQYRAGDSYLPEGGGGRAKSALTSLSVGDGAATGQYFKERRCINNNNGQANRQTENNLPLQKFPLDVEVLLFARASSSALFSQAGETLVLS